MSIAHEGTLAALRQKHNSNMAEMGEQIDVMNKTKAKCEKDKSNMERDLAEARGALDEAMRDRANLEKNCKMTQGLIVESNTKLDELARALNDADSTKKKLTIEAQDLNRQIEETENAISNLGKNKVSLQTQLEDTKALSDAEARERSSLLTKFKTLSTDCENLRMLINEESDRKNDYLRQLSKAQSEIQLWKSKFETEALGRIDELEGSKAKLGSKVIEADETVESLNAKIASCEKTKHRLDTELEDLQMEYERTHAAAIITEKRGSNFDKVVGSGFVRDKERYKSYNAIQNPKVLGEWKHKADDIMAELEASKSECRNYSSEVQGIKNNKNDKDDEDGDDDDDDDDGDDDDVGNIRCTASRPPTRRPPSNLTLSDERTRLTSFRYFLKIFQYDLVSESRRRDQGSPGPAWRWWTFDPRAGQAEEKVGGGEGGASGSS